MWKSSAIGVVSSRIGSSGVERSGSFRAKNGRSNLIGQPEQDSMRQLWETAMDGVESSAWEGISEDFSVTSRTSIASNTSSSSSPIARQGGKLLQVVKRKVNLSSGTRKASQNDRFPAHDAKDSSRSRNSRTQDGEIVSDKLLVEIETLRRKLEKKEKEMQKLKNEVSTLRITTAIRSVQPQSGSQAEDTQEKTTLRNSFDSDSSQLSCLDFSLAPSTGELKFEGKIKTKITPASKLHAESRDQPDSILSDSAAVGAPGLVEEPSHVNEVFTLEEVQSTTDLSASSQVQEPGTIDNHVEGNEKSLGEFKAAVSEPEYSARFGHDYTGGGLELPKTIVKEELYISTQSYVYKPEDEFFDINANASRSPPKGSASSAEVEDDFDFPIMISDPNNSFSLQKATSSKMTECVSAARSCCNLSDVNVDKNSRLTRMMDGEGLDENALTVPLSKYTTNDNSPAKEDPLKVLMKSCVMLEVDKLSKNMPSLRREESLTSTKHPDLITRSIPVVSPRRRREQSLTTAKHADVISRSTSVLSPPRSRPVAAQAYPNRGVLVSRQPLDSQVKAGESVEQSETVETPSNRIEMELGSKILKISMSEGSMEQMAGSDGLDFDNLPLPSCHSRSSYGSMGSQSPKYATTTADRDEDLWPVLPSTSPRGRGLPPSSYSGGSQLLLPETEWKMKCGSLGEIDLEEEVRQILEQSRLLLMSDERNVPGPVPGDKPFSVLALSRHRRKMVKNKPLSQHSPEKNQHQERPEHQEEQAIVLYGDSDAWNIQSSKVDHFPRLDAEQENEDQCLSRPSKLPDAVEAVYKKDDLQLVWELEVQNSKNQILSSLPRRSRFFFEANIATTPEVL